MTQIALSGLANLFSEFNIQSLLISVLVLSVSLSFHEFAHAWMAYKLGDDTAALQGRLTMNPLAHLDPIGALAFIVAKVGWAKPVPINPVRFDRRWTMKKGLMLTSLAGPTANLILSVVSYFLLNGVLTVAYAVKAFDSPVITVVLAVLQFMSSANIYLMLFNLLPLPPLDGFKVFGAVLPNNLYYKVLSVERYISIGFLILVFLGRGILSRLLSLILIPFNWAIFRPIDRLFEWIWRLTGLL